MPPLLLVMLDVPAEPPLRLPRSSVDPVPVATAVPLDPVFRATVVRLLDRLPPFSALAVPVPPRPTYRPSYI